jgi:NAD(P)-dependent dehydrogenase (short-subunit alcohol dehydrogenase family)
MTELRFDGRVAVVTGAGRGIGRAYARLLAARGASVVVNDLDALDGVTDTSDVSTVEGAEALVRRAVEQHGRVDVVVNNAGNVVWAGPPDADDANLRAHLDVHVGGSFHVTRAAWPHFVEQGYGRVVMTTSTGLLGLPTNLSYATAKGGVLGMTRALAVAGRKVGVKVNAVAPAAATRLGGGDEAKLDPALVAPLVAYLAHESCPVTGEVYTAGGGRFARLFLGSTPGVVDEAPTVESVVAQWDAINDTTGFEVPADLLAWSRSFLSHHEG